MSVVSRYLYCCVVRVYVSGITVFILPCVVKVYVDGITVFILPCFESICRWYHGIYIAMF